MSLLVSLLSAAQVGLTIGVSILGVGLICYTICHIYIRLSRPLGDFLHSLGMSPTKPDEAREIALAMVLLVQFATLFVETVLMLTRLQNEGVDFESWEGWATLPRAIGEMVARAVIEAVMAVGVLSGTIVGLRLGG